MIIYKYYFVTYFFITLFDYVRSPEIKKRKWHLDRLYRLEKSTSVKLVKAATLILRVYLSVLNCHLPLLVNVHWKKFLKLFLQDADLNLNQTISSKHTTSLCIEQTEDRNKTFISELYIFTFWFYLKKKILFVFILSPCLLLRENWEYHFHS